MLQHLALCDTRTSQCVLALTVPDVICRSIGPAAKSARYGSQIPGNLPFPSKCIAAWQLLSLTPTPHFLLQQSGYYTPPKDQIPVITCINKWIREKLSTPSAILGAKISVVHFAPGFFLFLFSFRTLHLHLDDMVRTVRSTRAIFAWRENACWVDFELTLEREEVRERGEERSTSNMEL